MQRLTLGLPSAVAILRDYTDLVETLSLYDVDRRVAWFLLRESTQRGIAVDDGVGFELTLTHQQIASRLGTVREMVTRAFGRLEKSGLIAANGRLVRILNEWDLVRFATE